MEKPNRKDFPNNRNGRSRYLRALRKYEDYTKMIRKDYLHIEMLLKR